MRLDYGRADATTARADVPRLLRGRGRGAPGAPAAGPSRLRDRPDGPGLQGVLRRPPPALRAVVPGRRPGGRLSSGGRRGGRTRPSDARAQARVDPQAPGGRREAATVRARVDAPVRALAR